LAYFFIGIVLLALLLLGLSWFVKADPKRVAGGVKIAAILLAIGGLIALVAVGRIGLVMMAAAFLLPIIMRWRNARRMAGAGGFGGMRPGPAGPTPGQSSSLETRFFSMTLDHDTGDLDGEVKTGRHRGRRLSELDLPALIDLLAESREDTQSTQVLVAYLDRHHGPDWRNMTAAEDTVAGAGAAGGAGEAPMTRDEAFRILGLEPNADPAAIKAAHHRLMLKFHPDQGGSAWFAARINEARDLLLGR